MKTQLLFIPMAMLLYACDKTEVIILEKECVEDQRLINCEDLKNAVLKKVEQWTDYEINKLCFDLLPYPTAEDDIGHEENLNELVKRLNTECGNIITTLQCYACIETGPAISHVNMELDSIGVTIMRELDISTPSDGVLRVVNFH